MGMFEIEPDSDADKQRAELEETLRDTANQLLDLCGAAAFFVPGRHNNGLVVAVGTREDLKAMLEGVNHVIDRELPAGLTPSRH